MPQIIDQNALKNKNTGTNIKKPWNWFGTIGLIIVFIYGKIRIPVTEPIDAKSDRRAHV